MSLVCFVMGARPNFVKSAPVIEALDASDVSTLVVHTGQHYDADMSDVFFRELGLREPDVYLGVGSGTHAEQTARALTGIEAVLLEHRPEIVVVPGDVNSTLAAALAAVKLRIPVCHLEAGLRSFDNSMPEEHNRRLTDHVSDLLLVHSESAIDNLANEGIRRGVSLVGNTMVDSLLANLEVARAQQPWSTIGVEPGTYALITLHRPSLVDDAHLLEQTMSGIASLSRAMPVVFPVHPRTRRRLESSKLLRALPSRVELTDPLSYLSFIALESEARVVITDSGGVQEETSALGVPCFTLRASTERPVTIELGTNTLLGADPGRIADIVELSEQPKRGSPIPYWDGSAGPRAAGAILDALVAARGMG